MRFPYASRSSACCDDYCSTPGVPLRKYGEMEIAAVVDAGYPLQGQRFRTAFPNAPFSRAISMIACALTSSADCNWSNIALRSAQTVLSP